MHIFTPCKSPDTIRLPICLLSRSLSGEDNVEVYHSAFTPLEWQLIPERPQNACYVKVSVF